MAIKDDDGAGTLPTTRAEALAIGAKQYFTGEPCPRSHLAPRYSANGLCVACRKERYERNREAEIARSTAYRRKNGKKVQAYQQSYRATRLRSDPAAWLLQYAVARARKKRIPCSISKEWLNEKLSSGCCELSGLPFDFEFRRGRTAPFAPSIDRIDSSKGYTPDNCRLVIWLLNHAVGEFGEPLFREEVVAYLKHQGYSIRQPRAKS